MMYAVLFSILGVCLGIGSWQLAIWLGEIRDKKRKYEAARAYAQKQNKPLLVCGGPWGARRTRRLFHVPAHGNGDVCLDIDRNAIAGHPNGLVASITHIPFADKSFGAVFVSHVLEHLPSTVEAERALDELNRIAAGVFIAYPSKQSIAGWLTPGHRLWVWQKGSETLFKQRGRSASREDIGLETRG
ncbi:MAG: methyltransferase domain-containing protein [Chloroflexi bacterium]|nr:methyltransferase domain-containing protein [Chloroflexota bacterium]